MAGIRDWHDLHRSGRKGSAQCSTGYNGPSLFFTLSLTPPSSLTFSVQMSGPMSELVTQSVEWNQELDDTILKVCG